jgi:formylglycine-generating enzyme required for sulfatase activity
MLVEPEIVEIETGPVSMGTPEAPEGAQLRHLWRKQTLQLPRFGVAKTAVTVGEYLAFAAATNYPVSDALRTDARFTNQRAPVAFVSWIDSVRYTQWLSREIGKNYRLLRDAEWEKAARGGLLNQKFPWGNESPDGRADWNNADAAPKPVGSFVPNGYGLQDMVGSMWCWCEECFDHVAAPDKSQLCYPDTQIKDVRLNPVVRGGSYKTADENILYCAYRHEDPVDGRYDCIGFRVACNLP